MKLRGVLESIKKLTESDIRQMLSLMHIYYEGVDEELCKGRDI